MQYGRRKQRYENEGEGQRIESGAKRKSCTTLICIWMSIFQPRKQRGSTGENNLVSVWEKRYLEDGKEALEPKKDNRYEALHTSKPPGEAECQRCIISITAWHWIQKSTGRFLTIWCVKPRGLAQRPGTPPREARQGQAFSFLPCCCVYPSAPTRPFHSR